ncbi:MAG: cytidyltransferase-related domain protein [Clostridiales bacterium]|jgi:nicotinic acid mononucleotide adenylyltransferase|nr:cytidyltransferase-related domain protein [Clostridiales bacterium]
MQKRLFKRIISDLTLHTGKQRFLQQFSRSKKDVLALLRDETLQQNLAAVSFGSGRITCAQVLAICESTLAKLAPVPEEGWLLFTYRFACDTLFPAEDFAALRLKYQDGALFFLALLQVILDAERAALPFDPFLDFELLSEDEYTSCDCSLAYSRFVAHFRGEYVYETMRLGLEVTPFCTLEHIAGVHYIAMQVARGLKQAGLPIDIALVSGSAVGHDLGKFGCKPGERVPYLHYYYTDRWFKDRDIGSIGHIAANHSAWDLEIENLPAESLVLIYADFRVKQRLDGTGKEITELYPLEQAFDVILQKLDAVDEEKAGRYRYVYAKLADFEDYLHSLGIEMTPPGRPAPLVKDIALMSAGEVMEALKFSAIEHSIALMHRLGAARQFAAILESGRGETNWRRLRAYLSIFEEYATYLSSEQKVQLLGFLYELLMHREGDIRRQAAALMGKVISRFQSGYQKELPAGVRPDPNEPAAFALWEKYIEMTVRPDHKLAWQHKSWLGYTLKIIVQSALANCGRGEETPYLDTVLHYYQDPDAMDDLTVFVLLDSGLYYPPEHLDRDRLMRLTDFASRTVRYDSPMLRTASLRLLRRLAEYLPPRDPFISCLLTAAGTISDTDEVSLVFLKGRLLRALGRDDSLQARVTMGDGIVADIFLDNLKTATPWVIKAVNIKLLLDRISRGDHTHLLHIAAHFSNLIKVSERVVVRHDAGAALLKIVPLLSCDQRNEIAVELAKGLEVGEYEFSKYIPAYLAEFSLWLPPEELDEMISQIQNLLEGANDRIASVALDTAGVLIECYNEYRSRFPEPDQIYRQRRERLLGLMLKGLASYRSPVRQDALLAIGKSVFGSKRLDEHEKRRIFSLCSKKLLFLINETKEGDISFFYRAAALSRIYRFITEQILSRGGFSFACRDRIAFFPGTFDPFTLSHKGIVQEIRDLGFEVMLAIDEFSWSKKTQPRLIRRRIAGISVADEFNVHIFPDNIPVNIANPADLHRLSLAFPEQEIYMVVGSDVIANASSYRAEAVPDSIHSRNHIIFRRLETVADDQKADHSGRITGKIIEMTLPIHLDDISSSQIRDSINLNRDIRNLIDPLAQGFIYDNGLYLREPQYKPVFKIRGIIFEQIKAPDGALFAELCAAVLQKHPAPREICQILQSRGHSLILMRDQQQQGRIMGFASQRQMRSNELFSLLGNGELASYVRKNAAGKSLLISGLFLGDCPDHEETAQLLLTEILSNALKDNCTYALFQPLTKGCPPYAEAVMTRQGFRQIPGFCDSQAFYAVDMRHPVACIQNLETTIKEPFSDNESVLSAIKTAHRRLQAAMTALYPGQLVLSLPAGIIHDRLVEKITAINGVPSEPTRPRVLGPYLCLPFGKLLRGHVVPNTVTKTLHTDKVYDPEIQKSSIEAFSNYPPLESQLRTIKSFNRPVILVDDLIHSGDRMLRLDPLFRKEGIQIKQVLVGLLSGMGRDLMAMQDRPVDCVYDIPNLQGWFVESTLHPFIGGDSVRRDRPFAFGLHPAINMILPYIAPRHLSCCPDKAVFDFSACCLENARDILLAVEEEYRIIYERNLTLSHLSEAVRLPLCPDKGDCMAYDPNLAATVYLENDLEMLERLRRWN